MDADLRANAVEALVSLSTSTDYRDRIDAGRGLSCFLDLPQAEIALRRLVLDQFDTAVTLETVISLVRRRTETSLSIVAESLHSATLSEDDALDWIEAGIEEGIGNYFNAEHAWIEAMKIVKALPTTDGIELVADFMRRSQPFNPEA